MGGCAGGRGSRWGTGEMATRGVGTHRRASAQQGPGPLMLVVPAPVQHGTEVSGPRRVTKHHWACDFWNPAKALSR